jgi:Glycosyl transferase family 2
MYTDPHLSVVIPTYNRAALLRRVLESYTRQTFDRREYEVVVVDDGSTDDTQAVCAELATTMNLRRIEIAHGGPAAAKNAGIDAAAAPLILLADDDDLAHPELLSVHSAAHAAEPDQRVCVLGFGTWDPALAVTPLMHYLTDVGQLLSSYPQIRDGQLLDFRFFWSGRISAKRALLVENRFSEDFAWLEDVELGYRLSAIGLRVLFRSRAVSSMTRAIDYDSFLERCARTGTALALLRRRHPAPVVDDYCRAVLGSRAPALEASDPDEQLARAERVLPGMRADVRRLEEAIGPHRSGPGLISLSRRRRLRKLYDLYDDAFRTAILSGFLAAERRGSLDAGSNKVGAAAAPAGMGATQGGAPFSRRERQ